MAIINNELDTVGDVFDKQVCDPRKQLESIVVTFSRKQTLKPGLGNNECGCSRYLWATRVACVWVFLSETNGFADTLNMVAFFNGLCVCSHPAAAALTTWCWQRFNVQFLCAYFLVFRLQGRGCEWAWASVTWLHKVGCVDGYSPGRVGCARVVSADWALWSTVMGHFSTSNITDLRFFNLQSRSCSNDPPSVESF